MKRRNKFFSLILSCSALAFISSAQSWQNDRYLNGYQEATVTMSPDYSGDVTCTVVRRLSDCGGDRAILYIHGYNDYFFQEEMGNRFVDSCWNFYAVDLRKYGRSLKSTQTPYQMRSINEYYPDIDSTINIMSRNGIKEIVLMGHSTGGLVAASYMNHNPSNLIKAVVLNSPFLDWNMSPIVEKIAIPFISCIGRRFPNLKISQGETSPYGESLLKQYHGEWDFDTNLKTIKPRKVSAGWIRGISNAQSDLKNHSFIKVPILLLHSTRTINGDKWTPEHQSGDAVLDVNDISRLGRTLGPDVTEISVEGGLHDLILSKDNIRNEVYNDIFGWLNTTLDK